VRFVVIFGSQETSKVSNHLLSVLNVKAQTGASFKERDNDRLIESEHTYACIYHSKNATLIGVEYIITADQYNSLPNREKPSGIIIKLSLHLTELIRCFQSFQQFKLKH
jgi:hypothetical protein